MDGYKAPFSSENFWLWTTVALSFLFGKNCPIMDYLDLKDSSHDFSANCVISFFSSTFNTPCMCRKIRCNGYCVKNFGFRGKLNGALVMSYDSASREPRDTHHDRGRARTRLCTVAVLIIVMALQTRG